MQLDLDMRLLGGYHSYIKPQEYHTNSTELMFLYTRAHTHTHHASTLTMDLQPAESWENICLLPESLGCGALVKLVWADKVEEQAVKVGGYLEGTRRLGDKKGQFKPQGHPTHPQECGHPPEAGSDDFVLPPAPPKGTEMWGLPSTYCQAPCHLLFKSRFY